MAGGGIGKANWPNTTVSPTLRFRIRTPSLKYAVRPLDTDADADATDANAVADADASSLTDSASHLQG